jgi:hypothetical protein
VRAEDVGVCGQRLEHDLLGVVLHREHVDNQLPAQQVLGQRLEHLRFDDRYELKDRSPTGFHVKVLCSGPKRAEQSTHLLEGEDGDGEDDDVQVLAEKLRDVIEREELDAQVRRHRRLEERGM